jgi:ABC-type polar amino acid transport system ATPase subunit
MLTITSVCKQYGDKKILENISFSVKKGHIALLLGSSGVGKSTLLRVLSNLETVDSGTITSDGRVGMVFQDFNLFENMTAERNITFPLEQLGEIQRIEAKKIAHELLEKYNLMDKKDYYPKELSGGQKQRLAIARTIAQKPHTVCLDEPTSALDPLLTTSVANSINQLAQENYIVVVSTHDTTLIEKLDCTMYLMEHGSIVESAESHVFKQNPSAFEKIQKFING